MKDFIEKLIGRLEELKTFKLDLADAISELMKKDRLDNYISKEEVVEIVNQLAEEYNNGFCEWKFTKSVADGGYFYSSGCNHKRFSDLHSFEFCPYCGKRIKVVE